MPVVTLPCIHVTRDTGSTPLAPAQAYGDFETLTYLGPGGRQIYRYGNIWSDGTDQTGVRFDPLAGPVPERTIRYVAELPPCPIELGDTLNSVDLRMRTWWEAGGKQPYVFAYVDQVANNQNPFHKEGSYPPLDIGPIMYFDRSLSVGPEHYKFGDERPLLPNGMLSGAGLYVAADTPNGYQPPHGPNSGSGPLSHGGVPGWKTHRAIYNAVDYFGQPFTDTDRINLLAQTDPLHNFSNGARLFPTCLVIEVYPSDTNDALQSCWIFEAEIIVDYTAATGPAEPAQITRQPPLRQQQRSDGLGTGGPPRAVQTATAQSSLRRGPDGFI